jgi:hypothetical protein
LLFAWLWWKHAPQLLHFWSDLSLTANLTMHNAAFINLDTKWMGLGGVTLFALVLLWCILSALGRDLLLRRLDSAFGTRRFTLVVLTILRILGLTCLLAVWLFGFAKTYAIAIVRPAEQHSDPAYVPGFAIVVCLTLAQFVLWSLVSWIFRIAPVLAMAHDLSAWQSLRAALGIGPLRAKLIEINLVMGIVKIALLVLALVFSACPLPFSSVETQTFLTWWWIGVGVLYLLASDYFHVVRTAAYVTLWKAFEPSV